MTDFQAPIHPVMEGVEIGIGTWAWGDRLFWGYGKDYQEDDIHQVFISAVNAGIRIFDTAEVYGQGKSELFLGKFIQESEQKVSIWTKFMPYPWRLLRRSLDRAIKNSLKRLGQSQVDLYQIHAPLPPVTIDTWMEAMLDVYEQGLVRGIGVSNYDRRQTQRAYEALNRRGNLLVSNQVEYNLLNRKIEQNGLLKQCKEMGVTIIAYSPLAQGLLTGKYTPEEPPRDFRGSRSGRKKLAQIQPLVTLMRRIGAEHAGKTPAQVSINWTICKGTIPIPGIKNLEQLQQNLGALDWRLTSDEVAELDEMSDRIS
jgi:aryl-alcohol dehydrogenase-like predicted oxidoreductase